MSHKLDNYLRTYRKRSGLSQAEIAFLLGAASDATVSRYEGRSRLPSLRTALACEVIFRVPVSDLFAGTHRKVEEQTIKRAVQLASRLSAHKADRLRAHKLAALKAIIRFAADRSENRA